MTIPAEAGTPAPAPVILQEREPVYSPTDPVRVKMDEAIAAAIQRIVDSNQDDWAMLVHFIALKLIKTRDVLEVTDSKRMGGYAQGLRFLFELYPRAMAELDGKTFKRDKTILGEEAFIEDPLD